MHQKNFKHHFAQLCPKPKALSMGIFREAAHVPQNSVLIVQNKIKQIKYVYHLSQIVCCQTYYASMDNLGQKLGWLPIEVFITSFLLLVYLVLLIPLYIKRRKNEQQDQPINFNQIPKSLESLLMNFGIITTSLLMWILLYFMNRYGFSSVKQHQKNK